MVQQYSPSMHSRLPWTIEDGRIVSVNSIICECGSGPDALLIVHRVNTYDKLVEALESAQSEIIAACKYYKINGISLPEIEAALQLAKDGE